MKLVYKHTDGKNSFDVCRLHPDKDKYLLRVNSKVVVRFNCNNEDGIIPLLPALVNQWLDFNSEETSNI